MKMSHLRTKRNPLHSLDPIGVAQSIKQKTMKLKLLILNFSFLILSSCASNRPVATTHTERLEERVMPIPVGADTIEIELCRDTRLECPNEQSESQCRDTRLERPMTRKGQNPTSTASPQSVQICRATSCAARERIEEKEELKSESSVQSVGENSNPDGTRSVNSVRSVNQRSLSPWRENSVSDKNNSVSETTFLIDLHFNAHSNPNARGTEVIVANDATTLELRFASRLAHTTSDALDIPLRCIKSESETPHHRLAMLHLTPQSIILEVCFCTSPEDVEAYRKNREKLAAELAWAIAELLPSVVSTDNRQRMSQNVNYKQNLNPDGTVDR